MKSLQDYASIEIEPVRKNNREASCVLGKKLKMGYSINQLKILN